MWLVCVSENRYRRGNVRLCAYVKEPCLHCRVSHSVLLTPSDTCLAVLYKQTHRKAKKKNLFLTSLTGMQNHSSTKNILLIYSVFSVDKPVGKTAVSLVHHHISGVGCDTDLSIFQSHCLLPSIEGSLSGANISFIRGWGWD